MSELKIKLEDINKHWWYKRTHLEPPPGPPVDPLLLIQQPAVVERPRGRTVGSTASRIDTSTCREPSAFKRNTGYTGRGHGHGCGRRRGRGHRGSLQTSSRGGSTQVSSRGASQATTQSNQLTQEQAGGKNGGKNSGGSQDTTVGALLGVSGNIQLAFRGLGAFPFHKDFTEGSFSTF